jgi:hypothetical protein
MDLLEDLVLNGSHRSQILVFQVNHEIHILPYIVFVLQMVIKGLLLLLEVLPHESADEADDLHVFLCG